MAFPIILVGSATAGSSDTAASGAGPATALTGTAASTDGTGLIVTLDGSPDLTGVAVDGSHVIYLADSTAGARNFGKITAADNSAKTVTVSDAFGLSLTGQSWAIGGVRATVYGTESRKLLNNNAAAGDAMPGWTIQMQSGHAESGAAITPLRAGNLATDGAISLIGETGAATRPTYTSSGNGITLPIAAFPFAIKGFDLLRSGSSGGFAISGIVSTSVVVENMRIKKNGSIVFATGISMAVASSFCVVADNYIEEVSGKAIVANANGGLFYGNFIAKADIGISAEGGAFPGEIKENVVTGCAKGILVSNTQTVTNNPFVISNNTIHGNTGDGIEFDSTQAQGRMFHRTHIQNNQITGNGGRGINFTGSGMSAAALVAADMRIRNNNFGTGATANTSGTCNISLTDIGSGNLEVDPQYTNAGTGDFSIGQNTKGEGYPKTALGDGIVAGNRSYIDIGAVQRGEPTPASIATAVWARAGRTLTS